MDHCQWLRRDLTSSAPGSCRFEHGHGEIFVHTAGMAASSCRSQECATGSDADSHEASYFLAPPIDWPSLGFSVLPFKHAGVASVGQLILEDVSCLLVGVGFREGRWLVCKLASENKQFKLLEGPPEVLCWFCNIEVIRRFHGLFER